MNLFSKEALAALELPKRLSNAKTRLLHRHTLVRNANTPYHVIYSNGLAKLRHYPAPKHMPPKFATPLLFISPLAVNTSAYDLLVERSLICFLQQRGFNIYLIDWGKPTRKHSQYGFSYYVTQALPTIISHVRKHSGEQTISTHGWSMGGLFSMLYTAYSQDKHIKNMVLVGAPVDAHASGYLGTLAAFGGYMVNLADKNLKLHPRSIPAPFMHTRGWVNMLAFKAVDPIGTTKSAYKLVKNLANDQALIENATKSDFLIRMQDYPGRIIKDIGIDFWLENNMVSGHFLLNKQSIDLANISANLLVITGNEDKLVTTEAAKPIISMSSSEDATLLEIAGGHVGIMSSKKTSEEVWPQLADWLAGRSTPV